MAKKSRQGLAGTMGGDHVSVDFAGAWRGWVGWMADGGGVVWGVGLIKGGRGG